MSQEITLPVGQSTVERDITKVKVLAIHAGVAAPDFAATTLDGKPFKLSDLRGKIVLLDFWATWCGPCVAELPNVKQLYEKFGRDNLVVVGISFDRDPETARKFVADRQLSWTQIWAEKADEGPIAGLFGVGGIPATFLIGADGKVIERDLRGDTLTQTAAREVRKLARGGPADSGSLVGNLLTRAMQKVAGALPKPLPPHSPEASALLKTTIARYRTLHSYRDNFTCVARLEQKGESPREGRIEGSLAWAPDRLAVKTNLAQLYGDGRQVTRYWPTVGRYMNEDQPANLAEALAEPEHSPFGSQGAGLHPLAAVVAAGDGAEARLPVVVATGVQPATRDGRSGRVVSGIFQMEGLNEADMLPFEAFIDDQRQLFEDFRLDYTAAYQAVLRQSCEGDPDAVERAEILITFRDVQIDTPIDEATFVLNEPGARKFEFPGDEEDQKVAQPDALVGRPAPALAGAVLDGSRFDLEALRGQVVVVAFWGTWAPQAEEVLRELPKAVSRPGVALVGVSRNAAVGETAVRRLIEKCGVRFPQVSDRDGELAAAWNVVALPLIYVVDREGRVSEVLVNWSDETAQALSDSLGKLVLAEPPAAGETRAATRVSGARGGLTLRLDGEPVGDARVKDDTPEDISASRWNMSEEDVDGDRELELIFLDWQRGLTILKPSTGAVQRVRLPGFEGANLRSAHSVRIDGEICWLCAAVRWDGSGNSMRETPQLCLVSPRGELLWTYQPALGDNAGAEMQAVAGDLDGDGRIEYVIGLTMYVREQTGDNIYMQTDQRGRLVWLDYSGRRIAERLLDDAVELLRVAPAPPGQPATLWCLSGGQLERLRLQPE